MEARRRNKCREQANGSSNSHRPVRTPALSHAHPAGVTTAFSSLHRLGQVPLAVCVGPHLLEHKPAALITLRKWHLGSWPPSPLCHCSNKTKAELPFLACLPCIRSKPSLGRVCKSKNVSRTRSAALETSERRGWALKVSFQRYRRPRGTSQPTPGEKQKEIKSKGFHDQKNPKHCTVYIPPPVFPCHFPSARHYRQHVRL